METAQEKLSLKNKTQWKKSIKELVDKKGWLKKLKNNEIISIPSNLQAEIIRGFKIFYDETHEKYNTVRVSVKVTYELNATGLHGVFCLFDQRDKKVTVSYTCKKKNNAFDLQQAFRGAIHYGQILPTKTTASKEIDHCNEGGFKKLTERFIESVSVTYPLEILYSFVIKQDVQDQKSIKDGFYTFNEPVLDLWRNYHAKYAKLQELSQEDHKSITRKRKKNL